MPKLKTLQSAQEALPDCDRNSRKFSMKFYFLMFTVLEEFYFLIPWSFKMSLGNSHIHMKIKALESSELADYVSFGLSN